MEKDTKNLILAIFIIFIIAVITLSFGGITGQQVKSIQRGEEKVTKVYVSSSEETIDEDNLIVNAGDVIYVTVEAGSEGSKNKVGIHEKVGKVYKRKASILMKDNCGGSSCRPYKLSTQNYKTFSSWPAGTYCAIVQDALTSKNVEGCFKIA